MRGRPAFLRSSCSAADRFPDLVDRLGRVGRDVARRPLEVLRPEPQSRLARATSASWRDDVQLGVVEERVLVEVRRAEGQPRVVDDRDLGVHVNRVEEVARACVQRAGEQAAVVVVCLDQLAEHATCVVAAGVRLRRQDEQEPEIGLGRVSKLVAKDGGDLRRPEELILEVDQPLAPSGARGRRSRGCRSRRAGCACRSSPEPCARPAAPRCRRARKAATAASVSPVVFVPSDEEVVGDVCTAGPSIRAQASCQPTVAARRMVAACRSDRLILEVRSIPPTNAIRSSITIVFSWWQCSGRSFASSAQRMRVCAVSRSCIFRTSPREGRKSGTGAPAHASTRTSMRSASSARRLRRIVGSPSRSSAKSGVKYQPVRWTCDRALRSASAIRGNASAPSTRISRVFPSRTSKPPRPSLRRADRSHVPSRSGEAVAGDDCRSARSAGLPPNARARPAWREACFRLPTPTPEHARHCEARPSPLCCDAEGYELG